MQSRKNLVELFSSFIQFSDDYFSMWLTEPRLKRNMNNYLGQIADTKNSEQFWSRFWHKKWQQENLLIAKEHLIAYLQEPCYWIAQKTLNQLSNSSYKVSDFFQTAIAEIELVLKNYNPEYNYSLTSYSSLIFKSILNNRLRQKAEADICTDWALLRKVSKKRFIDSLTSTGLTLEQVEHYQLAWTCFKTIYAPKQAKTSQKLPSPTPQEWQSIFLAYQQQSPKYPKIRANIKQITSSSLEKSLKECATWIRQYLYPKSTSLNIKPLEDSGEILEIISSKEENYLETIITEEEIESREKQRNQISKLLAEAINNLTPESRTILKLYYVENLTQKEIAQRLQTKQYDISRKLNRTAQSLLKTVIQWGQKESNTSFSCETIQQISVFIEEWLTHKLAIADIK